MAGVAPGTVLELELDHAVWQHFFDAAALDLAGGERLATNHDRRFARHHLYVLLGQVTAVEHSVVTQFGLAGPNVALAKIVLAAGIHCEFGRQNLAVLVEKSQQSTPMVEMAVAHNQRIDL